MAAMLRLSRSRLYQLIAEGVFLPPERDPRTGRPFYPPDVQQQNMEIRQGNVGANGELRLFYRPRQRHETDAPLPPPCYDSTTGSGSYRELLVAMKQLGLKGVSTKDIEEAVRSCFPKGLEGQDEGDVIRSCYRFLRESRGDEEVSILD